MSRGLLRTSFSRFLSASRHSNFIFSSRSSLRASWLLLRHHKGRGHALGSCAAGTADAVDEVVAGIGQVVVDDVRDVGDVDAASGDVGGDQDAVLAVGEALESGGALGLAAVAMDGVGVVAELLELLRDTVGAMLGAREDEEGSLLFGAASGSSRPSFWSCITV